MLKSLKNHSIEQQIISKNQRNHKKTLHITSVIHLLPTINRTITPFSSSFLNASPTWYNHISSHCYWKPNVQKYSNIKSNEHNFQPTIRNPRRPKGISRRAAPKSSVYSNYCKQLLARRRWVLFAKETLAFRQGQVHFSFDQPPSQVSMVPLRTKTLSREKNTDTGIKLDAQIYLKDTYLQPKYRSLSSVVITFGSYHDQNVARTTTKTANSTKLAKSQKNQNLH